MRIALIADTYLPLRTSGAVQLRDLAQELLRQGHEVTVMVSSTEIATPWAIERLAGVEVLRLKAFRTKDVGYVRRTISELLLSFAMLRGLRKSPLRNVRWDGVIWYSPTIFLGPLAFLVKRASGCRGYLILRDIFPSGRSIWACCGAARFTGSSNWWSAISIPWPMSSASSRPSNFPYFAGLGEASRGGGSRCCKTGWRMRGMSGAAFPWRRLPWWDGRFLSMRETWASRRGWIFFWTWPPGCASARTLVSCLSGVAPMCARLRALATQRALDNVVFRDEVEPDEVPGLLAQCHIGLVALDPRHKTHNVPGKFLTYMYAGLPVLARINPGNDLADLIDGEDVGRVYVGDAPDALGELAVALADDPAGRARMARKAQLLAEREFSPAAVARQVLAGLSQ